jgi:hypothetical protein
VSSLTQSKLKELVTYDPETGIFRWNERSSPQFNGKFAGKECGYIHTEKSGATYTYIEILAAPYQAGRLAWLYMTGEWPIQIDHQNQIGTDNSWKNLRNVSQSTNLRNQPMRSTNTSGIMGVCWDDRKKRWIVQVTINRKQRCASFRSKELAIETAQEWYKAAGYHANHGSEK